MLEAFGGSVTVRGRVAPQGGRKPLPPRPQTLSVTSVAHIVSDQWTGPVTAVMEG
ncbi:hypothetical protein GCM10010329_73480 [Streptomyces spiroverticillatus]|nr:hypothetical protein GCM10010329_73480 [Streptomyces spiroverticillatus]